jgi:hypothetical protein
MLPMPSPSPSPTRTIWQARDGSGEIVFTPHPSPTVHAELVEALLFLFHGPETKTVLRQAQDERVRETRLLLPQLLEGDKTNKPFDMRGSGGK